MHLYPNIRNRLMAAHTHPRADPHVRTGRPRGRAPAMADPHAHPNVPTKYKVFIVGPYLATAYPHQNFWQPWATLCL